MASTGPPELFTLTRSDGGRKRPFPTDPATDEKGHVNYYRVVDEDEEQKWLTSVGMAIASQTGKPRKYTLEPFYCSILILVYFQRAHATRSSPSLKAIPCTST